MATQKKLTPALARRADALAKAARARMLAAAREDLALIQRRKAEIAEAFYDIGEALVRLRKEPIPKLLGFKGFVDLCKRGLSIAPTTADRLIDIVERLPRRDALKWGKEKAHALIALADATAAEDSPQKIDAKVLGKLDPAKATVRELQALAQKQRAAKMRRVAKGQPAAKATARPRGRTTTEGERSLASRLQAGLRKAGAKTATAVAVATKPGAAAKLRVELPIDRLEALKTALNDAPTEALKTAPMEALKTAPAAVHRRR
jgi:hypothetical protein